MNFKIRLGHKMMNAEELPMPSTLFIENDEGHGFRLQISEQGELTISKYNPDATDRLNIQPNTANQITLL